MSFTINAVTLSYRFASSCRLKGKLNQNSDLFFFNEACFQNLFSEFFMHYKIGSNVVLAQGGGSRVKQTLVFQFRRSGQCFCPNRKLSLCSYSLRFLNNLIRFYSLIGNKATILTLLMAKHILSGDTKNIFTSEFHVSYSQVLLHPMVSIDCKGLFQMIELFGNKKNLIGDQ